MSKYDYEFERVDSYCYPNSHVLRNKLDIRDEQILNTAEREFVSAKLAYIKNNPIKGRFDLKHLQAINRYLFCDIYDWAGELRTVNISKGNQFCNCLHLETYANEIFTKLKTEKLLKRTSRDNMPNRLAYYLSEVNALHPFREGNGRTQRVFIEYLAQTAGWHVDFSEVSKNEMIEASAMAFALDYDKMIVMFKRIISCITPEEQKEFQMKIGLVRPQKNN